MSYDYVIYSSNESSLRNEAGFWSKQQGWTTLEHATCYTYEQIQSMELPLATGHDAISCLWEDANNHYGSPDALSPFQTSLAYCIDSMLQDDARGEVVGLCRNNAQLQMISVNPEEIDVKNLEQYEMLIFDGGNSSGDCWKHIFHIKEKQHFFIDENPIRCHSSNNGKALKG
jgi:hypothetical protein